MANPNIAAISELHVGTLGFNLKTNGVTFLAPRINVSGKQGYELAKSLSKKGFNTTLISGPTNLEITRDINLVKVETADEMLVATQENLPVDVAIFSAAVADFKINKKYENKIKKIWYEEF